jgi:paired amphipathic helix protein Sin3a
MDWLNIIHILDRVHFFAALYSDAMDMNESYGYLMESVRSILDGSSELSTYEEQLREVFGSHAYIAYTLDKLVQNVGRQVGVS